jgi:regulator of replication initiation timing
LILLLHNLECVDFCISNMLEQQSPAVIQAKMEMCCESLVEELNQLKLENSVIQKFVDRKTIEIGVDDDDKKKKKMKKNHASKLTIDQKFEIANAVHDEIYIESASSGKSSEKMIGILRAVLEETEIRIGESKRDAYEFKRDVVIGAENSRTGNVMAERVTRYFGDKLEQIDVVLEKLRLKNSTLKSQIHKIEHQLTQKEESGDVLHYIDFHQLQIENKQYAAKIHERNEELLLVKLSANKVKITLTECKKRLNEKMEESSMLQEELKSKKAISHKLELEDMRLEKESRIDSIKKSRLMKALEDVAEMPDIEDYIEQKKEMYDLASKLKTWAKKVEIIEMAAKKAQVQAHNQSSRNSLFL